MMNSHLDNAQGNVRYFDGRNLTKTQECKLAFNPKKFTRSDLVVGIDMGRDQGFVETSADPICHWRETASGDLRITECEDGKFYIRVTE